jgi:spore cortex formation protein SpoVR/YcgB (stage V sporulation)
MTDYLWTDTEWTFKIIDRVYKEVEKIAVEELGLGDIYPNQIEIITSEQMLDAYSSIGLPIYYHHWSFGKHFTRDWEMYKKGIQGLAYEIVINSNPCISYLMEENTATMQALVLSHAAIGHNWFFKNNALFREWTDAESIIDYLVFAKDYITKCEVREGRDKVESFLDSCHALMSYGVNRYKRPSKLSTVKERKRAEMREDYRQSQVNELFDTLVKEAKIDPEKEKIFPPEPEENILYFCEKYAPELPEWKREIIRIVRKMSQYFYPQSQTKVMNEGCLVAGSLIATSDGMIPIEELVRQRRVTAVWDGDTWRRVYGWVEHAPKRRIKLTTHHGYVVHGGADHKLLVNGEWKELDNLLVGDVLPIDFSNTVFAQDYVDLPPIKFNMHLTHPQVSEATGIPVEYYRNVKTGRHTCNEDRLSAYVLHDQLFEEHVKDRFDQSFETMTTCPIQLTEDFAYWLGVLIGDGSMSNQGRNISIVNADDELLTNWKNIGEQLFGLEARVVPEETKTRIHFHSMTLLRYLHDELDIKIGYAAPIKQVPALILKSPRSVVASFLRGLFDADGCAVKMRGGCFVYISRSVELTRIVQELLLRFGVISRIRQQLDLCHRLTVTGQDAEIFANEVGFGLSRKQDLMAEMITKVKRRLPRRTTTKIVAKEEDEGVTFDFSVEETHRYVSGAFTHHNCATFVHYRIMNRLHEKGMMTDGSYLEFITSHTNVVSQPVYNSRAYSGINPYALGFAMMQDISRICKDPTEEDRRWFPDIAGSGDDMAVLRDAWVNYRDESFIRQFLSPKVIRDFSLFRVTDVKSHPTYEVTAIHDDAGYEKVRETMADNYERHASVPQIEVLSVNPNTRVLSLQYRAYRDRLLFKPEPMVKHMEALWSNTVYLFDSSGKLLG